MKMCPIFVTQKLLFLHAEILGVQRISALIFVLVISVMELLVWCKGVHRRSGVE